MLKLHKFSKEEIHQRVRQVDQVPQEPDFGIKGERVLEVPVTADGQKGNRPGGRVPGKQLTAVWNIKQTVHENVQNLVKEFRVSSLVVLRRAYDLDRIDGYTFIANYNSEVQKALLRTQPQNKEAGGDFYATLFTRHSATLTQTIVGAAFQGRLLYREAASLLALKKIETLDRIAKELGLR